MKETKIANFEGLYGDTDGKYSAEYLFLEQIETRSQTFDWNIKPHIHSQLFQVFIVKKGTLLFNNGQTQINLTAPCIIEIPPSKLHGLVYSPLVEGQILTVSESIIEDIFKTSNNILESFDEIQIITEFDELVSFEKIENILKLLHNEIFGDFNERNLMLKTLLLQIFVNIFRLSRQNFSKTGDSIMMNYFRKFQKNIKVSKVAKSIPEYASELNITPVHLNRICKSIVGKSAIELVHQNLINEAQKYLLHTSYSVSEIAYLLKFEYPNYFAKLFKKYVGLAPNEFRKRDRA